MTANKIERFRGFWDDRINKCTIEMKGTGDGSTWFVKLFMSANVWKGSGVRTMFRPDTPIGVTTGRPGVRTQKQKIFQQLAISADLGTERT